MLFLAWNDIGLAGAAQLLSPLAAAASAGTSTLVALDLSWNGLGSTAGAEMSHGSKHICTIKHPSI